MSIAVNSPAKKRVRIALARIVRRNPTLAFGAAILAVAVLLALLAPHIAPDPLQTKPSIRLTPPGAQHWFGTDNLGRDVFARTAHGARLSFLIGVAVAASSIGIGLAIGLVVGMFRWADAVVSRILDGLMAVPAILLAIALVSLTKGSVMAIIVAIAIPEIPRVVRLTRAIVLSVREQPFVEATIAAGSSKARILRVHILPFTWAPLIVQATFICASAILLEAGLSFLGAGLPPEVPSWGNMIAGSRLYFQASPWIMAFPGAALALVILAVNLLGDGLRDALDPKLKNAA